MKLFRFGAEGAERPGLRGADGTPRDVSRLVRDYDERFFAEGGLEFLAREFSREERRCPPLDLKALRLASPIARPSKIVCIGLNYRDHAKESGAELPSDPKIFMKATSALCGVNDALRLPPGSTHTDHEVELAVVIGHRASYVSEADALDFVAGYTICNDYSERDYQKNRAGQFVKGKSADTFAPLGPFLVTRDEGDFAAARLWCSVNGHMRQDSDTSHLIFGVPQLVSRISHYMTLLPGDVISTGTPAGVGMGMDPPSYLRAGDVVEYGIAGIGEARQVVVDTPRSHPD